MAVADFPNILFVYGPQSPNAFCNGPTCAELQGDWIVGLLSYLRQGNYSRVEASVPAEVAWRAQVLEMADASLFPRADSWYLGANIDGKKRIFMPYAGGFGVYRTHLDDTASNGYAGLVLTTRSP